MPDFEFDPSDEEHAALVERVEYRVDQVTAQGQTIGLNKASVYAELAHAARSWLQRVPRELAYPAARKPSGANARKDGLAIVVALPADFLRFVRIRLGGWKRAVDELTPIDSSRYRLQANRHTAADAWNPVAALAPKPSAPRRQVIECYPADNSGGGLELIYIGDTAPEDVPEALIDAVVWEAAGRVLQSQKEAGAGEAYDAATRSVSGIRHGQLGEARPAE